MPLVKTTKLIGPRSVPHGTKREVPIVKLAKQKQVVYGVVLDPYIVDAHADWCPPEAIEETAHNWLVQSRQMKEQHEKPLAAVPVESWLMPYPTQEDYEAAVAREAHRIWKLRFGSEWVHSGSWVLGVRVLDPEAWAQVLSGELDAYSIGGQGMRTEIDRVPMPDVEVLVVEAP